MTSASPATDPVCGTSVGSRGDGLVDFLGPTIQSGAFAVELVRELLVTAHQRIEVDTRHIEYAHIGVALLHLLAPKTDVLDARHDPAEEQRAEVELELRLLGDLEAFLHWQAEILVDVLCEEPVAHQPTSLDDEVL